MRTLTKEALQSLTPEMAIELLKEGNKRFISNLKFNRNLLQQVNETSEQQFPFATILSCIDSRTSAELIFDQGLGDIFSIRVAGNVLNDDILGSMEFACKISGSKVIVVLGHTKCGAIKGACDNVKLGHLSGLLDKIKPAIDMEKETLKDRTSKNRNFVENVSANNVRYMKEQLIKRSPIIAELVNKGEIAVIGGMYDIETGVVTFYEEEKSIVTDHLNQSQVA